MEIKCVWKSKSNDLSFILDFNTGIIIDATWQKKGLSQLGSADKHITQFVILHVYHVTGCTWIVCDMTRCSWKLKGVEVGGQLKKWGLQP